MLPRSSMTHALARLVVPIIVAAAVVLAVLTPSAHAAKVPGVPKGVEAARVSAFGAEIRWEPVNKAVAYDVVVTRKKKVDLTEAQRTLSDETTFVTKKLEPRTKYWVRVRAVGERGAGRFSKPRGFTTHPKKPSVFTAGTWNVCSESCSGYSSRGPRQANVVASSDVDVLALQEAGGVRVGAQTRQYFGGSATGLQLAAGGKNARYVFHRGFEQVDGGNWSIGNGRYATWARLRDAVTQREIIAVSVHLTSGRGSGDGKARYGQTSSMLSQLARVNHDDAPIIVSGDFNSGRHRAGDGVPGLMARAGFVDSFDVAEQRINADINSAAPGGHVKRSSDHIDHIYVTKHFSTLRWQLIAGSTSGLTDHHLLTAELSLAQDAEAFGESTERRRVTVATKTSPNSTAY